MFSKLFGGHCSCCNESRKRAERLEDKLFAEIDSNRLREAELTNTVLEAAHLTTRAGNRIPLGKTQPPEPAELPDEVLISETEIQQIADQFINDAERNGQKYSEDARILLVEAIRKEPYNYIS